jgi:hypothetical protein
MRDASAPNYDGDSGGLVAAPRPETGPGGLGDPGSVITPSLVEAFLTASRGGVSMANHAQRYGSPDRRSSGSQFVQTNLCRDIRRT